MNQKELNEMNDKLTKACANVKAILNKRDMYHPSSINWHKYQTAAEVAYEDVSAICDEFCKQTNAQNM